jgi:hypothetical protein
VGFFGIWAPGVLPFPVVIPLKDRVIQVPTARFRAGYDADIAYELEVEAEERQRERERAADEAASWRAQADVAEARRELEDLQASVAAKLDACHRVLSDPDASGDELSDAIGTVAAWEVHDANAARDAAIATHDTEAASEAEQRIIAAYAALEEACDTDALGPAPSEPLSIERLHDALGERFDEAMTLWRRDGHPAASRLAPEQAEDGAELGPSTAGGVVEALNECSNALAAETEMLEANNSALLANAEAQRQAREQDV